MSDEDGHFLDGPPVLRIHFSAFLAQQHQVVPIEVTSSHNLRQVELILHHLAQSIEVECLMGVILIPGEKFLDIWANIHSLSIGEVVSLRWPHIFISGSKLVLPVTLQTDPKSISLPLL